MIGCLHFKNCPKVLETRNLFKSQYPMNDKRCLTCGEKYSPIKVCDFSDAVDEICVFNECKDYLKCFKNER